MHILNHLHVDCWSRLLTYTYIPLYVDLRHLLFSENFTYLLSFLSPKHWQIIYMILMFMLAFASMFAQLHPQFLSAHWYLRRIFIYAAIVFAGVVPVMHWVVTNGGPTAPIVKVIICELTDMWCMSSIFSHFLIYHALMYYINGRAAANAVFMCSSTWIT